MRSLFCIKIPCVIRTILHSMSVENFIVCQWSKKGQRMGIFRYDIFYHKILKSCLGEVAYDASNI